MYLETTDNTNIVFQYKTIFILKINCKIQIVSPMPSMFSLLSDLNGGIGGAVRSSVASKYFKSLLLILWILAI